jgi:hypothetical protein
MASWYPTCFSFRIIKTPVCIYCGNNSSDATGKIVIPDMPLSVTQVDPIIDVFYVNSGRSWTFSSGTSWISDGDQWWPLPEIQAAPPRGPTIDISNFGGARCWTCRQHPQEAHRRHLQHRWWPLPDLPPVPPGGPPSRSSTLVVAAVGPAASTP